MAQGDSMALAETLRRPHILRYLSLSLPTNFTATASASALALALEAAGCELGGISKHTHICTHTWAHTWAHTEYEIFVYF